MVQWDEFGIRWSQYDSINWTCRQFVGFDILVNNCHFLFGFHMSETLGQRGKSRSEIEATSAQETDVKIYQRCELKSSRFISFETG
jgi:hypothetical protein